MATVLQFRAVTRDTVGEFEALFDAPADRNIAGAWPFAPRRPR